ncbi:hypothetical protein TYRP_015016 [Tyrophagus putrescentiae]|nr:hypothetical protein TYRP_015016 [Tyrophagus putrescentiae]
MEGAAVGGDARCPLAHLVDELQPGFGLSDDVLKWGSKGGADRKLAIERNLNKVPKSTTVTPKNTEWKSHQITITKSSTLRLINHARKQRYSGGFLADKEGKRSVGDKLRLRVSRMGNAVSSNSSASDGRSLTALLIHLDVRFVDYLGEEEVLLRLSVHLPEICHAGNKDIVHS